MNDLIMSSEKRTALILGASGLVGGLCLQELLKEERYALVVAPGRRALAVSHPKLRSVVADLPHPETFLRGLRPDDVFSCLGTTTAKTPLREQYRAIDHDAPLAVARLTVEAGAKRFLLVSSVGADARSPFFYTRLKGELEDAVARLPFEAVHLFRPSFLLGERLEARPAEALFLKAAPLLNLALHGPLRKYRPIQASVVARALVRAAHSPERGTRVHEYDGIRRLGL